MFEEKNKPKDQLVDEQINSKDQLAEYYSENFDWPEIIQNFKLTKKFINDNIENLDTKLLLQTQDVELETVIANIKYFELKDIEEAFNIKDPEMIVSLQLKKDEALKEANNKKIEIKEPKVVEESIKEVQEKNETTTQSEQAKLVRKDIEVIEAKPEIDIMEAIQEVAPNIVEEQIKEDVVVKAKDEFKDNSLIVKKVIPESIKSKGLIIVEQLCLERLKEIGIDSSTIVGDHLFKVYINRYNDLKMKYEFSISKFDDLILASLNAKA